MISRNFRIWSADRKHRWNGALYWQRQSENGVANYNLLRIYCHNNLAVFIHRWRRIGPQFGHNLQSTYGSPL